MNPTVGDSVRSYRPGDWFGIVGERAVVILPPTEKPRVAALWELVDGGAGFDVTLDALISGGLRDLPAFVLVSTGEGETRVVIRGPARAEFRVDGETVAARGLRRHDLGRALAARGRADEHRAPRGRRSADELPSYVVDGGLFRISRLDEAPAHEAPDEIERGAGLRARVPARRPSRRTDDATTTTTRTSREVATGPVARAAGLDPDAAALPPPPPSRRCCRRCPTRRPPSRCPRRSATETDHDGLTVTGPGSRRRRRRPASPGQPPAPDVTVPVARLLISNGEVVDVDRAVVIGRAPEARRFNDTEQPRLVTVPSPHLEISSTHIEVRPGSGADHGTAVVTDLGSTNGTVLVQPGLGPEDLSPGRAPCS